jgi:hypothetical protein
VAAAEKRDKLAHEISLLREEIMKLQRPDKGATEL